jgi:hypothetical protein
MTSKIFIIEENNEIEINFNVCLYDKLSLNKETNSDTIFVKHDKDNIFLSKTYLKDYEKIYISHSNICPYRIINDNEYKGNKNFELLEKFLKEKEEWENKNKKKKDWILSAATIVLENEDNKEILITKRNKNMRTFPNLW